MKPFRLINDSELNTLATQIEQRLQAWNQDYSLLPLQLKVARDWPEQTTFPEGIALDDGHIIACGQHELIMLIQKAAFDSNELEFAEASQLLLLKLIETITTSDVTQIKTSDACASEWKYTGHCTLALHLSCSSINTCVLLNPEWVYQQLPKHPTKTQPLSSVNEALNQRDIDCTIHLSSCVLSLRKLKALRFGDVLITDHPVTKPMQLSIDNNVVAEVYIGQHQEKKSIKIASIL